MTTTVIRHAAWLVAWDEPAGRHAYLRDADLAFTDDRIVHVGPDYEGDADREIDGSGLLVMPGLIDLHSHPSLEPAYKGVREEHGVPEMYMTGLYERSCSLRTDDDGALAAAEVAFSELLQSGVTSLVDVSGAYPGWVDLMGRSGLRGWVAPWYSSASWKMDNGHTLGFNWNEETGHAGMAAAESLMAQAEAHESGRLAGMYSPGTIDTCTEELLRDTVAAAQASGRPYTTHIAQSVVEFNLMVERHGKTPVQWAHDIGFLTPTALLAHAIFIDDHSWLHWRTRRDLSILADTGVTVAHCPTPFCRYGQLLEDFGRYLRAGVNMGIGTDTLPHNFLEEMRKTAVLARVAAGDINTLGLGHVLHAATAGAAQALGRDDLGRLLPGAKADLVLADLSHPHMRPIRDPLRSLVFSAADRAVKDVFVDGRQVVSDGSVTTLDPAGAHEHLQDAQARMLADGPNRDFAGRDAETIAPLSLPRMGANH
ncbi:MAG: amidohydrolase family protein [Alphaproteobacteria bacterium]|nr:amidohydrolase family protein [Alphaproteobacteria bacterium]